MKNHSLELINEKPLFDTPLIFNNDVNTSNVKNLLLIDSIVSESQLFYDSSNSNTFPIIYSNNSNRANFIQLLENKFRNGLERIAFVFHDNIKDGKAFLNQELFFSEDCNTNSSNTQLLIDIIRKFRVKNIDFLACNSLNYPNWVNFYDLLRKETGVLVGASNNNTGNLKYGGDWIMENTNQNVLSTYFNSNIENYASTLAVTVLSTSTVLTQALVNSYTWPVTVNGGTAANPVIISFGENISLSNVSQYFNTGSNYITYDGTGKTVTINNVTNYLGLINNGRFGFNGYHAITVKNINSAAVGSILNGETLRRAGWICQAYFGLNIDNISGRVAILIDNCSNSGIINSIEFGNGGIIGGRSFTNGLGIIQNCSNSGNIINQLSGGILGIGTQRQKVSVINCSNNGIISGIRSGGICGSQFGIEGNGTVTNCSNSGAISGLSAGGICGMFAGSFNNGSVSIINCSNNGVISGQGAGGICGQQAGSVAGTASITNCSNNGVISGVGAGGICGVSTGFSNGTVTITKCYNTGVINGEFSGGISGIYFAIDSNKLCSIINCYNIGNINGSNSGGITGAEIGNSGTFTPNILIENCFSYANIASTCGGICGGTEGYPYTIIPIVNIKNCYTSYNSIVDPGSEYVSITLQTDVRNSIISRLTNVYTSYINNWLDSSASTSLIGAPTSFTVNNPGAIWTSLRTNQPYILSSFPTPIETITQDGGIIYIQQSGNNIQYQRNTTTGSWSTFIKWPVTFVNSLITGNVLTISFTTNISITAAPLGIGVNGYFNTGSSSITYDGTGKTVTIDSVSNYLGFIQNGINGINGYSNITVQNINSVISGNSTLAVDGGYICQSYFGRGVNNIIVNNCSNSGPINNDGTGCITGAELGNNGGSVIISNCSNSGVISDIRAGGICGRGVASFNGNVSIINCSNSGAISGSDAGGICGVSAGFSNGIVLITNCFNNGIINGEFSGGITASFFGITNNNLCSVISCYNTGAINGSNAGGICGANIGFNYDGSLPKILIQNCYSLGNIAATCGGICGGNNGAIYTNPPIVNITNCYTSYNSISDPGSEYISITLPTDVRASIISRLTNVYTTFINAWLDSAALAALSGSQNIYRNSKFYKYYSNFGTSWSSDQNNTPFFITSDLETAPRRRKR